MAHAFKRRANAGLHGIFQSDGAVGIHNPARRVGCGLRVLAVVAHARHHLHMSLRLHVATHHAEAHQWFVGKVGEKTRDDRLKRTFAWCHLIGMPVFQHKSVTAILQ